MQPFAEGGSTTRATLRGQRSELREARNCPLGRRSRQGRKGRREEDWRWVEGKRETEERPENLTCRISQSAVGNKVLKE